MSETEKTISKILRDVPWPIWIIVCLQLISGVSIFHLEGKYWENHYPVLHVTAIIKLIFVILLSWGLVRKKKGWYITAIVLYSLSLISSIVGFSQRGDVLALSVAVIVLILLGITRKHFA